MSSPPTHTQITGKAEDRCAQGCEPCPAPPSHPHGAPASTSSWNFLYHESGPSLLPPPSHYKPIPVLRHLFPPPGAASSLRNPQVCPERFELSLDQSAALQNTSSAHVTFCGRIPNLVTAAWEGPGEVGSRASHRWFSFKTRKQRAKRGGKNKNTQGKEREDNGGTPRQ